MKFTEELKKEVFGPAKKSATLAKATIVERIGLGQQLYESPSFLKAAKQIAIIQKQKKVS